MLKINGTTLGWKFILTLVLLIGAHVTNASTIIYEDVQLVSGNSETYIGYFNQSVQLKDAGTYQASLSDFEFSASFDMLGLSISSSTRKMGEIWKEGSFEFEAEAGKYFLGLIYKTDANLNLGMYGINLSYLGQPVVSAVPLPASIWFMLSGLMTIAAYRRKV